MGQILFDIHDAASRFFHLERAMEKGLDALSPANIDVGNLDEFPADLRDDILKSEVICAGIERRLFMQSMTATVYGTFEYCLISSLRNYQIAINTLNPISHSAGVGEGIVIKELAELEFDYKKAKENTLLDLAKAVRDKVMHRGGLVARSEREDFLKLASQSYSVELLPFADGEETEQISIDAPFLRTLIAHCKQLLESVHEHLTLCLGQNSKSLGTAAGVAH